MNALPAKLLLFCRWWLIDAPKRLFRIAQTVIALVNNEFSFTLNLKLMFTPLFGDYSFIGRSIGFLFRIIQVVVGLAALTVFTVISFLIPVAWWVLPIVLILYLKIYTLIVLIVVAAGWFYTQRNTPHKRVTAIKDNNYIDTLTPEAKKLLNNPKSFLQFQHVLFVLKKAELLDKAFMEELQTANVAPTPLILKTAYDYAISQQTRYIEVEQIFLAMVRNFSGSESLLAKYGSSAKLLEQSVKWIVEKREELAKVYFWQEDYPKPIMGGIGRGMTGRITPALNAVSEDFTKEVRKGIINKIIGRKEEIKKIAEILSGSKVNVLIIGEPGSGKTSIVKGIAYDIMQGTEFKSLQFKRIVSLRVGDLLAGTKTSGDIAEKLSRVMNEVETSGDIILFIDEIHNLVAGEEDKNVDVSNIFSVLEPHLSSGRVQFLGATNIQNYRKYIEPNGSFSRLFQLVEIPQASKTDTVEILKNTALNMEKQYGITISFPALQKVVDLSDKLIHERVLPDKAIDILNRAATAVSSSTKFLTAEDIAKEISTTTHIPVAAISQDESQKLLTIETEMKKHVIGQDEAINQIGSALKRARVGIRNQNKPIASFLFVGTTGVGKTETAKTLAETYFGDPKTMIRLDMSEYQQIDSLNRLLGSNDGSSKGILTEAVRTRPYTLILLDEIEKAHPNILLTFLQILDDGRLTDPTGLVIDFTNSIIIATSNVGTREIQGISENNNFEEIKTSAMKEVRNHFAPEFLNRFNGIIVFRPLTLESVKKICDIMLNSVRQLADAKGVKLTFKPELIDELLKRGYSPEWGARPLARAIEDTVESYLAVKFLSNEIKAGETLELGNEVFKTN
ncbi:MAG TPA: ATP-dependent Clp protease ATP-binding subunit [Candidatus Saccharimonadales bacterium]|nr:ATP-dependent Clp protease ATP-binding subunit [Candidatus Saccharimonadales bacterium]